VAAWLHRNSNLVNQAHCAWWLIVGGLRIFNPLEVLISERLSHAWLLWLLLLLLLLSFAALVFDDHCGDYACCNSNDAGSNANQCMSSARVTLLRTAMHLSTPTPSFLCRLVLFRAS